jgi:hypothetical protein
MAAAWRLGPVRHFRRGAPAGGPALRLVPARTAALQLLTRYLRSLVDGPAPSSAQLTDAVVSHLHELMALSLSAAEPGVLPAGYPGVRAARLSAIKADIDRHLTDGSLTAAALAARHGITVRYPAQAVRGRHADLQPVRPGPAPGPRLPQAPPSRVRRPHGQLDRPRRRLRRPVVLQQDVPPPLLGHAVGRAP